ncbi:hypothetical protein [Parapedobacter sp. 10938]|uniref:hypothetical protein n=1 Tax=Parapedobacter flavus TaxID=3110225 RepID=UPI002DBDBA99|nr:hypothetical protein [Parapedobacter sp. 10938]MEC3878682.1 hypothetical protein [Parapedobacter sp. 10938]
MQEAENINGPDFQGTLYLDEVRISGKQAPAVETYTLQYLDKQCFGNHLKGHDVWGYRNAYTFEIPHPNAGTSAVPAHSLSQRYYFYSNYFHDNVVFNFGGNSSQEMPNEQYMKKGVLSRITYPTQGFTVFNFEANRYKVQQSGGPVTRIGGGLRVSSILHYDAGGTTPVSRKHYKYGESEDGTGVLINPPASDTDVEGNITYAGFSYEQVMSYLTGPNDVPGNDTPPFYPIPIDCDNRSCLYPVANETKTTYLPSSFLDFTYANGAPIYYTSVSEYREGSTQLQGKKVYRYYAPDVFHDITVPLWTGSHIEGTNIRRIQTAGFMGMKKAETSYKNVAGTLTPVLKTEYTYERYLRPMMIRVVYAFLKVEFSVVGGNFDGNHFDLYNQSYPLGAGSQPPSDYYESGQYGIAVGRMLLSKTIETDYSGPVPRAKQTEYFYDNAEYTQPSRVRVTDSKGVQLQTTYKYPYDYTGTVYQQMVNKNRIAPVIDEVVNQVSPAKQLSHKETTWGTVSGFQVPILVKQSEKGATLYPTYSYDTYDDKGNLLQVTRKITASINGPRTVYLWGYGKQYPIAEIRNATYATVVAALGGTTVVNNFCNQANPTPQQVRSFLQPLRTNSQLAGALVTTYTHEPHVGLRSKTDEKGSTVHYEYDDFQRLQWIKDNEEYPVQRFHYNYRTP